MGQWTGPALAFSWWHQIKSKDTCLVSDILRNYSSVLFSLTSKVCGCYFCLILFGAVKDCVETAYSRDHEPFFIHGEVFLANPTSNSRPYLDVWGKPSFPILSSLFLSFSLFLLLTVSNYFVNKQQPTIIFFWKLASFIPGSESHIHRTRLITWICHCISIIIYL